MKKIPLTIIILTNRNDLRFEKALESTQIADQILVVDHHSNNDWPKLKTKFFFDLVRIESEAIDFAEMRNRASLLAKHEWILHLDSDETIPAKYFSQLNSIISNKHISGAKVKRRDYFMGQQLCFGEVGNVQTVRLIKAKSGTFLRSVHEKFHCTGKIIDSKICIDHYPHNSINDFFAKIIFYSQLEAEFRLSSFGGDDKVDSDKKSTDPKKIIELVRRSKHFSMFKLLNYTQLLTFPLAKFIYNFFIKLGFLDGWRGFVYALMMSMHSLIIRITILEKIKTSD